jgi:putative transposase
LFSRAIVGWSVSRVKDTGFVEECLRMALWRRDQTGRPVLPGMIHHSDAGSQYTSIRFTETIALEGLVASIGSVGDAYDNAAAETMMGLFKNEAIAKESPFRTGPLRTITEVEVIVLDWVHWFNNDRLHSASATSRPRNTKPPTTLKPTAHQPVTPPTNRQQPRTHRIRSRSLARLRGAHRHRPHMSRTRLDE